MKKRAKKRLLRKYDGMKFGWFRMARDFVLMLLGAFLVFSLFIGVSKVNGASMEPTLSGGDVVFFTRINSRYQVGDVVFAKMPSGSNYVKRIVAMEGDVVDLQDGYLYINGSQEVCEHHIGHTMPEDGIVSYPYTVGKNMVFMVGDNRQVSVDSRSFGALPTTSIKGKLLFVE